MTNAVESVSMTMKDKEEALRWISDSTIGVVVLGNTSQITVSITKKEAKRILSEYSDWSYGKIKVVNFNMIIGI